MSLCLTESLAGQPDRKDLTTEGSAVPVTVVVPEEHVVAFVSVVSGTATAASPDPDSHSPGQRGAEFSGRHHVISVKSPEATKGSTTGRQSRPEARGTTASTAAVPAPPALTMRPYGRPLVRSKQG